MRKLFFVIIKKKTLQIEINKFILFLNFRISGPNEQCQELLTLKSTSSYNLQRDVPTYLCTQHRIYPTLINTTSTWKPNQENAKTFSKLRKVLACGQQYTDSEFFPRKWNRNFSALRTPKEECVYIPGQYCGIGTRESFYISAEKWQCVLVADDSASAVATTTILLWSPQRSCCGLSFVYFAQHAHRSAVELRSVLRVTVCSCFAQEKI